MAKSSIRIAQLSDIHFYESSDGATDNYRHSMNCLKEIQAEFEKEKPDYLIVTGDITNIGDKSSLERAYQWIDDKIRVDGDYYGLECKRRGIKVIAVPGNHDAFNAPSHGTNLKRWQSSLHNFYSVFHDQKFKDDDGVDYIWITNGESSVFVCRVDSCYLGDAETDHLQGSLSLDRVAKGKLSRDQSKKILALYDKGLRGELVDEKGHSIDAGQFMGSLKMLVMHHYLFEPSDSKAEALLHLKDKRIVFQNIAMSDFDILLCGHKHIADTQSYCYLDHFDPRGKIRLAFNHVRRSLGIRSLPLGNINGRFQNKLLRLVIGFLTLSKTRGGPLTDEHTDDIIRILGESLEKPDVLKDELRRYVQGREEITQAGLFDDEEIRELQEKIKASFTPGEKMKLVRAALALKTLIERLGGRPFIQIIAGSSAKQSEVGGRSRALNSYDVFFDKNRDGIILNHERKSWLENKKSEGGTRGSFADPLCNEKFFPYNRVADILDGN
jgi:3',5'-cyclic AMP phosphodiesterase CpdA